MRIAYVCGDRGVPIFGHKGSSTHVQEVTRGLLAAGHEVSIFARRVGGERPPGLAAAKVRRISFRTESDDIVVKERGELECNELFREQLRASGPFDLVYERHSLWSYSGMEHARAIGVPGLLEVNAPLLDEQRKYRGLALEREAEAAVKRAYGAASALLAVSDAIGDYLRRKGVTRQRVHVVPNGVDPTRFDPPLAPTLPGGPGSYTVGFVGTLRPWHGVPELVRAFADLRATHARARLLILGDGPARGELETLATELGVRDSVVFCGAVSPVAVPGILASMDVAVAPYPAIEGFYFSPLKVFEYMAAGRAIVAAGIGQITRLIDDGRTGLLYTPGDTAALTTALARLRDDVSLRRRLGTAARTEAQTRHTWSGVVDRIIRIGDSPTAESRLERVL